MSQDQNDDIAQLEDRFFEAAKGLLDAWMVGDRNEPDFQRIAKRHGLEPSFVARLYEMIHPRPGIRFRPSVAGFESYAEKQRKRPEVNTEALDLANNENRLGPSVRAMDALQKGFNRIGSYPPLSDLTLRQRLAASLGTPLGQDHLVLGRGVNHLISEIAYAFLAEGDRVAICDRSFPVYQEMAERSACTIDLVPVRADHSYDVEALCRSLAREPRIVFIGSPNNPTGVLFERHDFLTVLENLPPGTVLVVDECYSEFAQVDAALPPIFQAIAAGRNVISLRSFSKAHGLAGLRVGYAVARPEIATYLEKRREPYHTSQMVIQACQEALNDPDHVRISVELIRRERERLADGLAALGLQVWPSHGNFLLFHALPRGVEGDPRQAAQEITHCLESRHGIRIRNLGSGFRMPGHLRVTVGMQHDNNGFLKAMEGVLAELGLR